MSAKQACLERLVAAANAQRGETFSDALAQAFATLDELDPAEQPWVLQRLVRSLPHLESPAGAGLVAVWFGAEVEKGADPANSAALLLQTLISWCGQIETQDDDSSESDAEPEPEVVLGIQFLGQALVAHLARSQQLRQQARTGEVLDELERVEHLAVGALWVRQLLCQQSGELLVLHGAEPVGVRVSYHNLANCFHLFTLLQGVLGDTMPGAGVVDEGVLAAARGEISSLDHRDAAWWHYGQPDSRLPELASSVWGEAPLSSIGVYDGCQVLLLWPPLLEHRSWDSGFFGPAIEASPAAVKVIQVMSRDQVVDWRQRLRLD